jgi:hypothetical protein
MAKYDPLQPLWKRSIAGIVDFVLAFTVFAVLTTQVFGAGNAPAFIAQNPKIKYVSMSGSAFAATIVLTVGYFIVLGGTGGTVFQRLFGMKRAKAGDEMQEVIKTIVRSDGKRRVQIYRREDGLFSFIEEQRLRDRDGEPRWRSFPPFAAVCDSPEASEQQARAAIGWLGLMP